MSFTSEQTFKVSGYKITLGELRKLMAKVPEDADDDSKVSVWVTEADRPWDQDYCVIEVTVVEET